MIAAEELGCCAGCYCICQVTTWGYFQTAWDDMQRNVKLMSNVILPSCQGFSKSFSGAILSLVLKLVQREDRNLSYYWITSIIVLFCPLWDLPFLVTFSLVFWPVQTERCRYTEIFDWILRWHVIRSIINFVLCLRDLTTYLYGGLSRKHCLCRDLINHCCFGRLEKKIQIINGHFQNCKSIITSAGINTYCTAQYKMHIRHEIPLRIAHYF